MHAGATRTLQQHLAHICWMTESHTVCTLSWCSVIQDRPDPLSPCHRLHVAPARSVLPAVCTVPTPCPQLQRAEWCPKLLHIPIPETSAGGYTWKGVFAGVIKDLEWII